jgi:FemAB-related protein (PEP-CTERM system-associated)
MSVLTATRLAAKSSVVEQGADHAAFDDYVRAHPLGTFFHLSGWGEAARRAYGYEPIYLIARRGGSIVGVLPLSDVRAPLTGHSLVSSAFSVGGGPLADDNDAIVALLDAASDIAAARRANYIECRSDFNAEGWSAKPTTHATFRMPLIADEARALAAAPRKRRAEIRKALDAADAGVLAVRNDGEPALFYRLYTQSLHRLGTPVFPNAFLAALLDIFSGAAEISVAEHRGRPVAALVTFFFGDMALPYYVGATDEAREARAFDYLYWSAIRRAAEKGCATFDFGRSRIGSGAYRYKQLWGIDPAPLTYRMKLIRAATAPDVNPANPKFAAFAKLWPRLPSAVANRLGPLLAPNFP